MLNFAAEKQNTSAMQTTQQTSNFAMGMMNVMPMMMVMRSRGNRM